MASPKAKVVKLSETWNCTHLRFRSVYLGLAKQRQRRKRSSRRNRGSDPCGAEWRTKVKGPEWTEQSERSKVKGTDWGEQSAERENQSLRNEVKGSEWKNQSLVFVHQLRGENERGQVLGSPFQWSALHWGRTPRSTSGRLRSRTFAARRGRNKIHGHTVGYRLQLWVWYPCNDFCLKLGSTVRHLSTGSCVQAVFFFCPYCARSKLWRSSILYLDCRFQKVGQ